ncbi:hypothetical protein GOV06_01365 [Candidatus Woesearchaeota archaeon]|nr:hypothetical protein [Candidatus Woesearchaeota archaeon]
MTQSDDYIKGIELSIEDLAGEDRFEEIIDLVRTILDKEKQRQICFITLATYGTALAANEYGRVIMINDKKEYERAKQGMEDVSPHAVLYIDKHENVHGLEGMLEFVHEDNPLIKYYRELDEALQ